VYYYLFKKSFNISFTFFQIFETFVTLHMARLSGAGATRMGAIQGSASGPYSGKAISVVPSPNVQLVLLSYSGTFSAFFLRWDKYPHCTSRWNRPYEPSSVAHNELSREMK
jgi:hypothetical protein